MFSFVGAGERKAIILDISKVNRVTKITFNKISVTSPSVQTESHILVWQALWDTARD